MSSSSSPSSASSYQVVGPLLFTPIDQGWLDAWLNANAEAREAFSEAVGHIAAHYDKADPIIVVNLVSNAVHVSCVADAHERIGAPIPQPLVDIIRAAPESYHVFSLSAHSPGFVKATYFAITAGSQTVMQTPQ